MTIAIVQGPTTFTSSTSVAYASNVQAGHLLVCAVAEVNSAAQVLTDTLGNLWKPATPITTGTANARVWYAIAQTSGANTVNFKPGSAAGGIWEVSGLYSAQPDEASYAAGNGVTWSPGPIGTRTNMEFLVGAAEAAGGTLVGPPGWTTTAPDTVSVVYTLIVTGGFYGSPAGIAVTGAWEAAVAGFRSGTQPLHPKLRPLAV